MVSKKVSTRIDDGLVLEQIATNGQSVYLFTKDHKNKLKKSKKKSK